MSGKRNMVWPIAEASRAALLERFPPRYARVVAHHVTYGRVERASDVPTPQTARVVGPLDWYSAEARELLRAAGFPPIEE